MLSCSESNPKFLNTEARAEGRILGTHWNGGKENAQYTIH